MTTQGEIGTNDIDALFNRAEIEFLPTTFVSSANRILYVYDESAKKENRFKLATLSSQE